MVTQGFTATLVAARWRSAGRVCITGDSYGEAERIDNTTTRSWWPAEKNPRTDIAEWLGGCDERKTFR